MEKKREIPLVSAQTITGEWCLSFTCRSGIESAFLRKAVAATLQNPAGCEPLVLGINTPLQKKTAYLLLSPKKKWQ